jgi:hypothetical protein
MNWIELSNPVALWWLFLASTSALNISLWLYTWRKYQKPGFPGERGIMGTNALIWYSAVYVFGCAYRSILPKADVQRICLFDTWFSSVFLGRSVATFAELAFVIQWAIAIRIFNRDLRDPIAEKISTIIIPLIALAECFSWYAVITTNYIGNTFEESLWGISFFLVWIALIRLFLRSSGIARKVIGISLPFVAAYVIYMATVDVPMYFTRWQADLAAGKQFLGLWQGLVDLNTRWVVTHNPADWQGEMLWMAMYFSLAVWGSIALCYLPFLSKTNANPHPQNKSL